jgi:hypothetical protein
MLSKQVWPFAQAAQTPPPQSTSLSAPFQTPSEHVGTWQEKLEHTPLGQSVPLVHSGHVIGTPLRADSLGPFGERQYAMMLPAASDHWLHIRVVEPSLPLLMVRIAPIPFGPGGEVRSRPPDIFATMVLCLPLTILAVFPGGDPRKLATVWAALIEDHGAGSCRVISVAGESR